MKRGAQHSEYMFMFSQWENCKRKESVILSDSRSSDIPGAELWVSSPPPPLRWIKSDSVCLNPLPVQLTAQARHWGGHNPTSKLPKNHAQLSILRLDISGHTVIIINPLISPSIWTQNKKQNKKITQKGIQSGMIKSLCIPFIKGKCLLLSHAEMEVKYKGYKHGDHTAGCHVKACCSRCSCTHPLNTQIFSVSLRHATCPCVGREREIPCWTEGVGY